MCKDLDANLKPLDPATVLVCAAENSSLVRNFQSKQAEVFDLIEGGLKESEEVNEIIIHDKEADIGSKMDGDTFRNHVVKFRNESRRVVEKINDYTADNVHIAVANDYENELSKARNAFEQVRDDLDKVIDELDPASETES